MLLRGVGEQGQQRLARAKVLVVGVGALGCVSADLLCRAGVGEVTVVDRDIVEETNLQRQTLYTEADLGEPKAEAARRRLAAANSTITLRAVIADFTHRNAEEIALAGGPPSVVVDGSDNFEVRYLLNDLCVKHGLPFCYGGAVGSRGMAATLTHPGPCLRCIVENPPPPGVSDTCDTAGILAPAAAIVASCQAADAIRLIVGESVAPSLLDFDLWASQRRRIDLTEARNPRCPCCALRRFDFLDGILGGDAVALCGRNAVQVSPPDAASVDLRALAARLRAHGEVFESPFILRANLGEFELTLFRDGRAIVKGCDRPEVARGIYARYIGA